MTLASLVWTTDGDSQSVEHGQWRAVIRASPPIDGLVTIRFRITRNDILDTELTPVFLQVPADTVGQRLETLRAELEDDLLRRETPPPTEQEEPTDALAVGSPAPSPGVYLVRPPRSTR
jgi:hypothetical protein